jgi:large subunit ribosomal protein L11
MEFCKAYNAATESSAATSSPWRSPSTRTAASPSLKTPPAAKLLLKAAGVAEGLGRAAQDQGRQADQGPGARDRRDQKEDLNANDIDQAAKIIAGTARSMGITVE